MPGITGIIGKGKPEHNEIRLRHMVNCMMHESFYSSGLLSCEELNTWLGWVTFKNSFSDCMPLWNEKRDVCILFSGEDYTDHDQIIELKKKGHEFDFENASYLVHLYEEFGADFFHKLNGRFSGVILDFRNSSTALFIDRYGLNRLYYHQYNGTLYFSSEAKSLLAIIPELRCIDTEALAEMFSVGCAMKNKTLFAGISLIPGGSLWTYHRGSEVRTSCYFSQKQLEHAEPLTGSEYYQNLKETWIRILPRYLVASERVALSLTGGKDSRMILAWAQAPPGTLPCYTFGGMYRDCFDVTISRRLAQICQQPYQVIRLDETFFKNFSYYASRTVFLTDGNMDLTGSPGLFVNARARETAPVRLTGNYGQEILRSSVAFKPMNIYTGILESEFCGLVNNAAQTYYDELSGNRLSFVAFKQVPWHHYSRLASELSLVSLRSPYLDNEILSLAFKAPAGLGQRDDFQLRLIAEGNERLSKIETDRGLLHKPIPLYSWLKNQYQDFTFRAEYAYDYGMPHALAKIDNRLSILHLERLFLGRHKYYHFRIWYRSILADYVKQILLDRRTLMRPFLEGKKLEEMVNLHIRGRANFTLEIHKLLTVELIYRQFIDSPG